VLYLERILSTYDPDIVLLTFMPNDLFTNGPIGTRGTADDDQSPVRGRNDKDSVLHSLILARRLLMANDRLYTWLYLTTGRGAYFTSPPGEVLRRQVEITKALLKHAQRFCREHHAQLAVLSVPQLFQVVASGKGDWPGIDVDMIDHIFAEFAKTQAFTWLPALPTLQQAYGAGGGDLYYRFDGHLTERGNAVVDSSAARRQGESRLNGEKPPKSPVAHRCCSGCLWARCRCRCQQGSRGPSRRPALRQAYAETTGQH
jgi:hypothetical protein